MNDITLIMVALHIHLQHQALAYFKYLWTRGIIMKVLKNTIGVAILGFQRIRHCRVWIYFTSHTFYRNRI